MRGKLKKGVKRGKRKKKLKFFFEKYENIIY